MYLCIVSCIINGVKRDSVPLHFLQYDNINIVLSIMALVVIILHKLLKLFVYIHFQFGISAFSIAHLKHLPEIEKLLVNYGAKEVSLYVYYNNIRNIYILTKNYKTSATNKVWFHITTVVLSNLLHTQNHPKPILKL